MSNFKLLALRIIEESKLLFASVYKVLTEVVKVLL